MKEFIGKIHKENITQSYKMELHIFQKTELVGICIVNFNLRYNAQDHTSYLILPVTCPNFSFFTDHGTRSYRVKVG